jgi:hypothetical protein
MKILFHSPAVTCPAEFEPLVQAILEARSERELCSTLKRWCVWVFEEAVCAMCSLTHILVGPHFSSHCCALQADLQFLVAALNRLDSAFVDLLRKYGQYIVLHADGIAHNSTDMAPQAALEDAKILLDFTSMLLKNAVNKELYASTEVGSLWLALGVLIFVTL